MVRDGSVRIGTLESYRQLEEDEARGDSGEGTRTLHSDEQPRVYNNTGELPPILRGIECGPGGLATNGPNAIVFENKMQDVFVYCMAEKFSTRVMNRFGGACIRIENPIAFLEALNDRFIEELHRLSRHCSPGKVGRCLYVERRQNYHSATLVDDCFIKPPSYSDQYEIRMMWRPDKVPIEPVPLKCTEIVQYCERFEPDRK